MTTSATIQPPRSPYGGPAVSSSSHHHRDERKEDSHSPPPPSRTTLPTPTKTTPSAPLPSDKSPKSCLRPPPLPSTATASPSRARSRGLLKAMIERFSSTPLELSASTATEPSRSHDDDIDEEYYDNDDESSAWLHNSVVVSPASSRHLTPPAAAPPSNSGGRRSSASFASSSGNNCGPLLTDSERAYLERLLESGNASDMESARLALKDSTTFFDESGLAVSVTPNSAELNKDEEDTFSPVDLDEMKKGQAGASRIRFSATNNSAAARGRHIGTLDRRDSRLQQKLYHLHETTSVQPSLVISRMSLLQRVQQHYQSNSIIQASFSADDDLNSIMSNDLSPTQQQGTTTPGEDDEWDPFEDVASWLGEAHGLQADSVLASAAVPFKILGTYGSDTSCHPHVLSPPLMEALLNFCPETTATPTSPSTATTNNLWLKYSRSRDGGTISQLLRHVRASPCTIVAVETSTGHVLGSFTTRPWRLNSSSTNSEGHGGETDIDELESSSFVWKMRHPRYLATESKATSPGAGSTSSPTARRSIIQQVCQESEIQVFPFRAVSSEPAAPVQSCSLEGGIRIGHNELQHLSNPQQLLTGTHLGHALVIDPNLFTGSTSTSETFGNPCLTNEALRGEAFDVVNLEVWALTPYATIADAERHELSRLFLKSGR